MSDALTGPAAALSGACLRSGVQRVSAERISVSSAERCDESRVSRLCVPYASSSSALYDGRFDALRAAWPSAQCDACFDESNVSQWYVSRAAHSDALIAAKPCAPYDAYSGALNVSTPVASCVARCASPLTVRCDGLTSAVRYAASNVLPPGE